MKTKILGVVLALGVVAASVTSFTSCSEPPTSCQVGLAGANSFATVYVVQGAVPAGCEGIVQMGDIVGMEFYNPSTLAPTADGGVAPGTTFDTSKATLAIQTDFLGNSASVRTDPNTKADKLYSMGAFTGVTPDANGLCSVPTFTEAAQQDYADIPAVDGGTGAGGAGTGGAAGTGGGGGAAAGSGGSGAGGSMSSPEMPAEVIKYNWQNMEITVTPELQGTEFTADLTYTETLTPSSGAPLLCTIQYKAIGIWPAVQCSKLNLDGSLALDADGNQQPDDSLCSPCEDPDAGRTIASGIAPEIPTTCQAIFAANDPLASAGVGERSIQYYCVLKGASSSTKLPVTQVATSCGPILD